MKRKPVATLGLLVVGALAVAVEPAAAQTADTTTEDLIWSLNQQLLYIAVPITVLVEAILFYTVWKFRKNESPLPTKENRRLEITWTVATAIILLFVGVASYQVLAEPYVTGATAGPNESLQANADAVEDEVLEVRVTALKYSWLFEYPEYGVTTSGTAVIPTDRPVRFNITSADWLHSFHVPGLGLKQDAFPGESSYVLTNAQETGTYQLYCAEYCGVGHSQMLGTVEVRDGSGFEQWLTERGADLGNETA